MSSSNRGVSRTNFTNDLFFQKGMFFAPVPLGAREANSTARVVLSYYFNADLSFGEGGHAALCLWLVWLSSKLMEQQVERQCLRRGMARHVNRHA